MAEEGICPIESNIKSTAGGGKDISEENDYQFDDGMDDEDFADQDDALFDDDDGDGLDGDDDWGSVHSQDDQDIISAALKNKAEIKPVIGVNDENPFGEGNEVAVRNGAKPEVRMDDPKQKCWICDVCNGINNLLESGRKYSFRCCICSYAYHPNVAIIFSNDWDGVNENNPDEQIYTIWNCPFCTLKNDISWSKCDGCEQPKPPEGQYEIGYCYVKPKKLNGPAPKANNNNNAAYNQNKWGANNNIYNGGNLNQHNKGHNKNKNKNNHNRNIVRKPRIGNIGIPRGIESYPAKSVLDDKIEKRLSDIFGRPFRNKLLSRSNGNQWTTDCSLSHSRIEWASYSNDAKKFVTEDIVGRGFAMNQRTGWIATMSINYIWVFEPFGSCGYRLKARYQFTEEQKLNGEDVQNSRIRFVGESIFVWSFARSRVYSFKISYNSIILVDVIKDKYFKDSQTMDVAITDNLLILLFDRWCGVYKLYPKFEWYHAVAFATKAVNCFSFEICDYDDELDRTPMYQEPFFRDEDEEKAEKIGIGNNNNKRSKRNGRKSLKEKWRKQMKLEQDQKDDENAFYRATNKNYLFINAENQLIGLHPTNPTFDFLHIAKEAQHGKCKYCVSKRYGTFYLSNDGKELYQSSHLEYQTTQKLINLNSSQFQAEKFYPIEQYHDLVLRQGINKFCNLRYDETYGVSGRLLLFCQTKKSEYIIHQLFNHNELSAFSDELSRTDYYLMPGSARKPFNLYVYVYEMLYGEDLIETLLKSQYFNPAELKVKKQQELELKKIENQAQKPKEQDFLFVNNMGQEEAPNGNGDDNPGIDMDIEYEGGEGEGN